MSIKVSDLQPAEQDRALALMGECLAGESPAYFRGFHQLFAGGRPHLALIASSAGQMAGYLEGHERAHNFGDGQIPTANIGAVCTAEHFRRQGVARALLTEALGRIDGRRHPLTGVRAALPELYAPFGFVPVRSSHLEATVGDNPPAPARGFAFTPVDTGNRDELDELYDLSRRDNRQLIGPLDRSRRYFDGQHDWMTRLPRRLYWETIRQMGRPVGYLRYRLVEDRLELLEVISSGRGRGRAAAARLLQIAKRAGAGRIIGRIAPNAPVVGMLGEMVDLEISQRNEYMFRINDLHHLLSVVEPEILARRRRITVPAGALNLRIGSELVGLEFPSAEARFGEPDPSRPTVELSNQQFLELLWGCPGSARALPRSGLRADSLAQLQVIFPENGWVIWGADHY